MSPSPRQNRVDPRGAVIATPARGAWMGNRGGALHDERGRIRRTHAGRRWIYCLLEFKGRRREVMQPGRYTELFFLDEATALAAGHRPCAECQRARYDELRSLWPAPGARADAIDRALHPERIDGEGRKVTYEATLSELPDGTMVLAEADGGEGAPHLLWEGGLHRWRPGGYADRVEARPGDRVAVLTPRALVEVLARGFEIETALGG
jgi:hypothetical protein